MEKNIKQINIENYEINVSRSTSNGMKNKKIQKNKIFKIPNKTSGFTLVESLFAVLILTFTITGLMVIVSNSLFSARYAKDEITVNYLMQEVVDSIRNDRDNTVFFNKYNSTTPWSTFVGHYSNCSASLGGCYFNVFDNISTIQKCPSGVCPFLYYNETPTTSFYNYDNTKTKTNFIRKIVVTTNGDEMIVTVTVNWKNGSVSVTRTLSASFLNWQQQK